MDKLQRFKFLTQYISDLHLEKNFPRNIKAEKPFLILAGDIGYPFQKSYVDFLQSLSYQFDKVFIITGNHEYDDFTKSIEHVETQIESICATRNNLFYLQKNTHVLCAESKIHLAGCTFWSELPRSKTEYHKDHKKWVESLLKKNPNVNYVVATHHCPLFECLDKNNVINFLPNYFASDQSDIIKLKNMVAWVHGHSHLNRDIFLHGKWIMSNQYGYFKYPVNGCV